MLRNFLNQTRLHPIHLPLIKIHQTVSYPESEKTETGNEGCLLRRQAIRLS
jgi:hypothetical protein